MADTPSTTCPEMPFCSSVSRVCTRSKSTRSTVSGMLEDTVSDSTRALGTSMPLDTRRRIMASRAMDRLIFVGDRLSGLTCTTGMNASCWTAAESGGSSLNVAIDASFGCMPDAVIASNMDCRFWTLSWSSLGPLGIC